MASTRRLITLSSIIKDNTAKVDAYIQEKGLPEPSFDASYPPMLHLNPEADKARQLALEALDELRDHLLGPFGSLVEAVTEIPHFIPLHNIVHFGLANGLPIDSAMSISELAKAANMDTDDASRIVQSAVSRRILLYTQDGNVTHSAASKALVTIPAVANLCNYGAGMKWKTTNYLIPAIEKWPGAQEPTQTAYNLAQNTDLPFFEHIAQTERLADEFADAMDIFSQSPALRPDYVLDYDWRQHAHGTVVDVGGGYGQYSLKIAEKNPDIKIIVQDRPEVVTTAPKSASENVTFQEHDFFTPQTVHGADVYFYRWILHDWSDKYAIRILQALKGALKPRARVVIMDAMAPEPGALSPFQDRKVRNYDMVMKLLFNAKERTERQWRELLGEADEQGRFQVVDVLRPAGSQLGFLVVQWSG